MSENVISTNNLTRDFTSVRAVDHVTLEVPRGAIFGFLGPNGSGKTTTIRLLLGLIEPSEGQARVLGQDTRTQANGIRIHCGALLEHTGLYERLSALDNLEFYGRVWRLPPQERQARIQELFTNLGLWERRTEIVSSWSRGMKQKLAIARALLHRPELIFLDEPTAGLDPVAAAALHEDLASLAERQGVTVFLTTHNLAEAEKLCSQVAVIRQGKLLAIGSPDKLRAQNSAPRAEVIGKGFTESLLATLRARPEVVRVELRNSHLVLELRGETDVAPLVSLMVAGGAQIEEIHKGKASLEEVFLTLMEEENVH